MACMRGRHAGRHAGWLASGRSVGHSGEKMEIG